MSCVVPQPANKPAADGRVYVPFLEADKGQFCPQSHPSTLPLSRTQLWQPTDLNCRTQLQPLLMTHTVLHLLPHVDQ
jgi:hypothetical protein